MLLHHVLFVLLTLNIRMKKEPHRKEFYKICLWILTMRLMKCLLRQESKLNLSNSTNNLSLSYFSCLVRIICSLHAHYVDNFQARNGFYIFKGSKKKRGGGGREDVTQILSPHSLKYYLTLYRKSLLTPALENIFLETIHSKISF